MGCGNTIIASDVGNTRLLVDEGNGLSIGLSCNELVNAIEKCYLSAELTNKLGNKARLDVIQSHTIERASEYYFGLFSDF